MQNKKISLCLTNYNRYEEVLNSFVNVADDNRISEIVISDDASDIEIFKRLQTAVSFCPKVKLYRSEINRDCYGNKRHVISLAENEWVAIIDSDNIIDKSYIDAIYNCTPWHKEIIYQPVFAMPAFNFTEFEGELITRSNVHEFIDRRLFDTALNAMNYFCNRDWYLDCWDGSVDPVTADSIFHNYNHLKAGGAIYFAEGLTYNHTIHAGSHYVNNVKRTPTGFYESIVEQLRNLR